MKVVQTIAGGIFLLAVVGYAGYLTYNNTAAQRIGYSDASETFNTEYWTAQIRAQGAPAAYILFKERNQQAPVQRQHFAAHVFGSLIARNLGASGVTVCDNTFGFGCYHGLFAQIIAEGGIPYIQTLDEACIQAFGTPGGCQHGIGHGILEYVGYQHIEKALELCKGTTQKVPLIGCTSGVFMAYNTPLKSAGDALSITVRDPDPENPLAPCLQVDEEYKASCYYERGQWAFSRWSSDTSKMFAACDEVSGTNRALCFEGIGTLGTGYYNYDKEKARALCAAFPRNDEVACRAGVSWAFFADPPYRSEADTICKVGTSVEQKECLRLADLTLERTH